MQAMQIRAFMQMQCANNYVGRIATEIAKRTIKIIKSACRGSTQRVLMGDSPADEVFGKEQLSIMK